MKLTRRERVLVSVLGAVLFLWVYYQFLITPQLVELDSLKQQREQYKAEMTKVENAAATEKKLDENITAMNEKIKLITNNFFTTTEQEEFILLFNEMLQDPNLNVSVISFTPFTIEKLGETELESMNATLSYEGDYPSLMNLLRSMWKFQKKIIVKNINMARTEGGRLSGSFEIGFYRMKNSPDLKDDLFRWYIDEDFYKENPFSSMSPSNGLKINYLFIGGDPSKLKTDTYVKFTDIVGHWAEAELNDFGEKRYIQGNQENQFKPDEAITRGDFIILLDRVYQWPVPEGKVDLTKFGDYSTLGSYESSIAKAIFKGFIGGYVAGYTDNTLRPREPITYEEVEYIMRQVKTDPGFNWNQVGEKAKTEKGFESVGLTNKTGYLSKGEAVYLLYHFK
ncbi:MAG: hypothetical protein K0R93_1385 [Anaerosolibacter sp.]|jgi:Tfp pilus assembly protein PilO|uniref:type II secretion system protein GspM n=1 Tax=Anaerosolibacter sp. TaxID=1872527 RepID=UPI002636B10D|nr:type II secretion system protein GspM [Anaerosolibacter sp.]MDF2546487.1 hypothetical protein [Anaerosolibacter sp.]